MPGIDTDLEGLGLEDLPARLAKLLREAVDRVERDAVAASADATARSVGVIARTGAALATLVERLGRMRARQAAGGADETEEADMDDAEDAGAWGAGRDLDARERADIERGLRNLAVNLRLGTAGPGDDHGARSRDAGGGVEELGEAGAPAPVRAA